MHSTTENDESNTSVIAATSQPKALTRKELKTLVRPGGKHSLQQSAKAFARCKNDHPAIAKLLQFYRGF